ncbi:zinc metalloprotease [Lachnoclostridium phytofermentans]|nr:hypothetical protein [Lachnoclostridium phytofermentans]
MLKEKLMLLVASLCSGILVMIMHELPKAILYRRLKHRYGKEEDKKFENRINPVHFVDPIGLIFCVIYGIGFSKPYYYRMKEKKWNQWLGITGLLSLLLQFFIAVVILKFGFHMNSSLSLNGNFGISYEFLMYFLSSYAIISIGMLITNLFPLISSDMSLLVAANQPVKFVTLLRSDYMIKMVWMFLLLIGIMTSMCNAVFEIFMR